jgi:uroporphyrinogen-III synthase
MPIVLSTKVLPLKLKRHLFAANIDLVEYNAIKIERLDINFPKTHFENAIFTSQNATKLAFEKDLTFENVFCVGKKTEALLALQNIKTNLVADNAEQLAKKIVNTYPHKSFDFFCSAQRREELPDLLSDYKIEFREHHLYQSVLNRKTFANDFDAVLCFSPMGVKAYYENHTLQPTAICIGETTASEARRFTSNFLISTKTSLESVIVKAVKVLK